MARHDAVGVVQLLEQRRAVYQEVKGQFEQLFGDGNKGDMTILSEAMREGDTDDEDDAESDEDDAEDDAEESFHKINAKMLTLKIQLLFLINDGLKQAGSAAVSDLKYAQRQLLFPSRPIFDTHMACAELMEGLCTAEDFPGAYTALQDIAGQIPMETYTRKHHSIFASLYLRIAQLPHSLGVDIPKCVLKSPVLFRRGVWLDVAERGLLNCRRDLLPEYPATDCTGSTVLHNLAGAGPGNTFGLFLSMNVPKGIPPNQQDFFGRTALLIAIENRNHHMIEYLLANGADITLKTNFHHTPLHYAAAVGCKRTCEMLVEAGAHVDAEDIAGRQPIFYASAGGHGSAVDFLLTQTPYDEGMDNLCYEESCPVKAALWNGHDSVALAISSRLLNLKKLTLKQSSMLWKAATFFRSWSLIRVVFDHIGDNVNTKDEDGESALLAAVEEQNIEMVYLILSHPKVNAGLVHNARRLPGRTALHMAVIQGNLEIVSAIAARADCSLFAKMENLPGTWPPPSPKHVGKTAYELALHYKHQEIASLLQDLMAKSGQ